jgi:hypothetical protein
LQTSKNYTFKAISDARATKQAELGSNGIRQIRRIDTHEPARGAIIRSSSREQLVNTEQSPHFNTITKTKFSKISNEKKGNTDYN